jgi:hypothetical protein
VKRWNRYGLRRHHRMKTQLASFVIVLIEAFSITSVLAQEDVARGTPVADALPIATVRSISLGENTEAGRSAPASDRSGQGLWGYIFLAPAVGGVPRSERLLHWGGGVEWRSSRAVGIAAEIGALHRADEPAYPLLMVAVNGSYHFGASRAGRSLLPFVTAGYTGSSLVAGLDMPWFNWGGGLNYFAKNGKGVRLEVRHHITDRGTGCFAANSGCHNWVLESRVGFNFGRSNLRQAAEGL